MFRKTKIVCTLGPATDNENVMRRLIEEGMNVARFNFSHGSHEEQMGRLLMLRKLREEMKKQFDSFTPRKSSILGRFRRSGVDWHCRLFLPDIF